MKKIKNNILLKNTFMLIITGIFSNIIEIINKIIYTKQAGINTISLYTLVIPTLILIITISEFSLTISISKISAEEKYDDNSLLKNAYISGFIINFISIFLTIIFSSKISLLLGNKALKYPIILFLTLVPFITISSIQKGFLHGKQDMLVPSVISIIEQILKLFLFFFLFSLFSYEPNIIKVIIIILFNSITEIPSILIMKKYINKKYLVRKKACYNKKIIKDIINISIPCTLIRLISAISTFIEPIILIKLLLKQGMNKDLIAKEYSIIKSYIIPILSMPMIIFSSISTALLPNITKLYRNKNYNEFNKKIIKSIFFSIVFGIICILIILIYPDEIIKLFYNIKLNTNYIYLLAPFFIFTFISPILSISVQAINMTNKLLIVSIITTIVKYFVFYVCVINGFMMESYILSIISGIISTSALLMYIIIKTLAKNS